MKTPTMLDLEKQYKGKTMAEFILHSYKESKNKREAGKRVLGLIEELKLSQITDDCNNFMKEEVFPYIWGKDFWKRDAGLYAYSFYDYFILGYGDFFKSLPTDEEIFTIFNCVTYGLVLMMHDDEAFYKHVRNSQRSEKQFNFFTKCKSDKENKKKIEHPTLENQLIKVIQEYYPDEDISESNVNLFAIQTIERLSNIQNKLINAVDESPEFGLMLSDIFKGISPEEAVSRNFKGL